VAEVGLEGARVVRLGSQREPAGMPQHVAVRLELELRLSGHSNHGRPTPSMGSSQMIATGFPSTKIPVVSAANW
jgi:hypothetical protein